VISKFYMLKIAVFLCFIFPASLFLIESQVFDSIWTMNVQHYCCRSSSSQIVLVQKNYVTSGNRRELSYAYWDYHFDWI